MRNETSILGTADPALSPLALARHSWRALVERGETEQPWCITFRLACPDRERAARLVAHLAERRASEASITERPRPLQSRQRWEVQGRTLPQRLSLSRLRSFYEWLETAAVLHDSAVTALGLTEGAA